MDLDCLTLNLERMGRYCLKRNSLIDIGRTIWRARRFYSRETGKRRHIGRASDLLAISIGEEDAPQN